MPRPRGFAPQKRRRVDGAEPGVEETDNAAPDDAEQSTSMIPHESGLVLEPAPRSSIRHAELARLLWSTDYIHLFLHELTQYAEVAVRNRNAGTPTTACVRTQIISQLAHAWQEPVLALVSSMRSRRLVEVADDRAALLRVASICSSLARERSRKILPFSVVARSLSWLMQRIAERVWAVGQRSPHLALITCTLSGTAMDLLY